MSVTHGTSESGSRWLGAQTLRVAVVGTGFMGRVHAESTRRAGGRVVAVTASGRSDVGAAALTVGAEYGYSDVDALLTDAEVDVLHVCAPNSAHAVGGRSGNVVLLRDPEVLSPQARRHARLPVGHAQGYQDCFDAFVADSYRAVRGDGPPTFELRAGEVHALVGRTGRASRPC